MVARAGQDSMLTTETRLEKQRHIVLGGNVLLANQELPAVSPRRRTRGFLRLSRAVGARDITTRVVQLPSPRADVVRHRADLRRCPGQARAASTAAPGAAASRGA